LYKFIKQILWFLSLLLVINVCLFSLLKEANYYSNYEKIDGNCSTYLLSDSHGAVFRNILIEVGICNFSFNADSYIDIERKLKYLINNSSVSQVILTADNHSLSKYRFIGSNTDRSSFYTEVGDYSNSFRYAREKYINKYIPMLNARSRSVTRLFLVSMVRREYASIVNKSQNLSAKQLSWHELSKKKQSILMDKRAKTQFPNNNISSELLSSLANIISLCRNNSIELIGLKFPLFEDYYSLINDKGFKVDSLLKSNGITVIDYSKLFFKNDNYFTDPDHLNEEGVKAMLGTLKANFEKYDY
jgi:hypothetical protein